jgi:phosphatidylethanolamine/phosphatidyl-N-methylethanolamine N-methyltransferase
VRPEAVTSSYRRWAPVYDRTFGVFTRPGRRLAVAEVNRRGGSVLEVGVGTGLSLADYGPHLRVTGIDFSDDMLARARAKVAERRLDNVVELRQMDARHLDFPDARFDTVVAMHLVSVVPEPERVVAEMARVCRPGGQVLILNHFLHEGGALAALGGKLAPLADQLGWHPDFREDRVLGEPSLELVERRPSPPFGMFTRLRLRKRFEPA